MPRSPIFTHKGLLPLAQGGISVVGLHVWTGVVVEVFPQTFSLRCAFLHVSHLRLVVHDYGADVRLGPPALHAGELVEGLFDLKLFLTFIGSHHVFVPLHQVMFHHFEVAQVAAKAFVGQFATHLV